ncbi:cytosine permease [Halioxenophilus sp. WMMB6]|uniref:cytosine permease n=1 Tax=Halioxenophilus sp. WMMB6 TaxID=3073815 RepID=UPI00295EFF3A|nr:cytosine permease [Halioxenophilus sp. WMMB6]
MSKSVKERIVAWWALDAAEEAQSADNPLTPLTSHQRRSSLPLLALAFGWGFLVTGLLTGGALGQGLAFMPDLIWASLLGNTMNFVIGGLVGFIGYKTACNSGLLYRFTYGNVGAYLPVLFVALLTIGWQGITVGAFGFAWAQSFDSITFYVVAIFAGVLFTATTYLGVAALEKVSMPSVLLLVAVGIYATWLNIDKVGGWQPFLAMSADKAAGSTMSMMEAINLVVGSWIVGAIVMADYTRFARRAWVALAIPFVVLIISQWFLQIIGSMGGIVSGTYEFTTYMLEQGTVIGFVGVIAMSLALWTTGDTNLYLPAVQTASVFRRPKRVTTLICGLLGTILGLGVYQHFLSWINLLAALVPPLIGPVIVDYYIVNRMRYNPDRLHHLATWNPVAIAAYLIGAVLAYAASVGLPLPGSSVIFPSLYGLVISMLAYLVLFYAIKFAGITVGNAALNQSDN